MLVHMLLYKILLSTSSVFLLNQRILFISSVLLVFVMNVLSKFPNEEPYDVPNASINASRCWAPKLEMYFY